MEAVHVIDDDAAVRDVIRILCKSISMPVMEYPSIDDFDRAEEPVLGCALLDLRLPRLGGLPGVVHVRSKHPGLPVIVMSAHATTRTVAQAMKAGAVDFFDKPFVSQDLLDSIQEAIARSRSGAASTELAIRVELLSRMQREVMTLLAKGASEEEAALALSIHKKSIQRHRKKALELLLLAPGQEHLLRALL